MFPLMRQQKRTHILQQTGALHVNKHISGLFWTSDARFDCKKGVSVKLESKTKSEIEFEVKEHLDLKIQKDFAKYSLGNLVMCRQSLVPVFKKFKALSKPHKEFYQINLPEHEVRNDFKELGVFFRKRWMHKVLIVNLMLIWISIATF